MVESRSLDRTAGDALSARELQVVRLVGNGANSAYIARELRISTRTVKFHLDRARVKVGARDRAHLVAIVFKMRLL